MSPDEIHFLFVLYLIYLSDCFVLPRASAVVLYARLRGSKWRIKSTRTAAVFARRFWLLRPLVPPHGSSFRLELFRCALGSEGFCSISPISTPAHMGGDIRYLAYDNVESVDVVDDSFQVNGEEWLKGAPAALKELKLCLDRVLAAGDRTAVVEETIALRFGEGARVNDRLAELEKRTDWLNLLCSIYTLWLLLLLPVMVFRFSMSGLIWGAGVPILLLHLVCGGLFLRVHSILLPREKGHRWESFLKMFICPPMMVRACDSITEQAGLPGDALAIMMATTKESCWRPHLQSAWRRLIPCGHGDLSPETTAAIEEFSATYRSVLKQALLDHGIEPASLEVDPGLIAKEQRICPRCEAVYRDAIGVCGDCGGVRLLNGEG